MNKFLKLFVVVMIIGSLLVPSKASFSMEEEDYFEEEPAITAKGKVIEILDMPIDVEQYGSFVADIQTVVVEITQGEFKGEVLTIDHVLSGNLAYDFYLDPGDQVLLWIETIDGELADVYVSEIVRDHYLAYLAIFFMLTLVMVGGLKGVKTVITLAITGFFVLKVLLPMILKGYNPITTTILIAAVVVTLTLTIISGINRKTFAAIVGTIGGVVIAGMIALAIGSLTKLTGLSNDEAQMLMFIPQQIDFNYSGLLFAGMIIGAMGAVLDVGMSIASAMDEVRRANPDLSTRQLIQSGINVGKDIMGTMSNTLILAYTGASMPLLLVFMAYDTPMTRIVNLDLIATEIVRALAGSIGLVFAIPITAVAAGFLYQTNKNVHRDKRGEGRKIGI